MKALIKNKRGFAFPTVLGTFVLVTGIAAGLFIMISNMTLLVSSDFESNELNFDAVNNVQIARDLIRKNPAFYLDHTDGLNHRNQLISNLNNSVSINEVPNSDNIWRIQSTITDQTIFVDIRYIPPTESTPPLDENSTFEDYFNQFMNEDSDPHEASLILARNHFEAIISSENFIVPEGHDSIETFEELFDYIAAIAAIEENNIDPSDGNFRDTETDSFLYVSGDGEVEPGQNEGIIVDLGIVVFVDGNLTVRANVSSPTIEGNFYINGNLTFQVDGAHEPIYTLIGTFYVRDNFTFNVTGPPGNNHRGHLRLGSVERPTFIFAGGDVTITANGFETNNNGDHFAFIFADNFVYGGNPRRLRGDIFANTINLGDLLLDPPVINLMDIMSDATLLYNWALPSSLGAGGGNTTGGEIDESDFVSN